MTADLSQLPAILDRLATQQSLSQQEQEILALALQRGQITLSGEERAVAIGGNADNAVILTGDRNVVIPIPKELADSLRVQGANRGDINQSIGNQTKINNNGLIVNLEVSHTEQQQGQQVALLLPQLLQAVIWQAYRDALPDGAERSLAQAMNYAKIVKDLQDFRRLSDFVQELARNQAVPQSLREKLLETIGQVPKASASTAAAKPLLQSHLLIALRPDATSDKLRVNGWLIPDDAERDQAKRFQSLDIDTSEKGVSCRLEEVPQVLEQLVELSLDYLLGKRYELTIEVFLPLDYLHEGVDIWKIVDLDDEIPIGTKYRVLVRTYDRLTPKYLRARLNNWYQNWARVQGGWDNTPDPDQDFEHLQDYSDINWKQLEANLTQKLGLKLTCGLVEEHREAVIKAVYRSATPIAIWSRCSLLHLDVVGEMNTMIASSCLAGLAEAIRQKRLAADFEPEPELHLGKHLAIMWEDPYRLTPDAMAQLTPPGQ